MAELSKKPTKSVHVPLSHRVLSEQLHLNSQQLKIILIIVLLLSFLTTYTLSESVPHDKLVIWFILVNFPSVLRVILFYFQNIYQIELRLLGVFNIVLAAWSGTAWGAVGYFFPVYGDANMHQFITVVLFGVTAGSVPGLSAFVPSYFAFSIPAMSGLALRLYMFGDEMHISSSIYCMIFLAINLAFSIVLQKSFVQSIRLRFENNDLVRNLRLEKDKAISASNAKSTFLAAASHDLRQPLHAIGFFIESLKKTLTLPSQIFLLQKIERTSDNLRGQLNDLLDISKIDAGIIKPQIESLSLENIFNTLKSKFSPLAQEKKIQLKFRPVDWVVESDFHMIDRILANLISNAIRYTHKNGKILIGCRKKGNCLNIEIHDTGIGIPNHLIDNIFAEYYQINNPERDKNKGLGLGLSIVKGMCELLGHNISVKSRIGMGTRFQITVPLSQKLPNTTTPIEAEQKIKSINGNILLIDDENEALDAMTHLISLWGHNVHPFETEGEALNFLKDSNFIPDIIITDFRLREMRTGDQAIRAINSHLNCNIPAIIITGDTAKDRMVQAERSGHILLHKPILPTHLKTIINETLLSLN